MQKELEAAKSAFWEAGTFLLAAAITRSCINVSPVIPSRISSLVHKLRTAGCSRIAQSGHDSSEVCSSFVCLSFFPYVAQD